MGIERVGMDLEGIGGGEYKDNTMHKIPKELTKYFKTTEGIKYLIIKYLDEIIKENNKCY